MTILDKYIFRAFAINYLISLMVLISIYIVLDLFFNFDEFAQEADLPLTELLLAIGRYYGAHLYLYFVQISGVITLFAMLFTLARLQSNNELIAIVASGMSLYRVALTVIVTGLILNGLWLVDQELVIPRLAAQLAGKHEASVSQRPMEVWFVQDAEGSLFTAASFDPRANVASGLVVVQSEAQNTGSRIITADLARWQAGPDGASTGIWTLERGAAMTRKVDAQGTAEVDQSPIHELSSSLTPAMIVIRQSANWIQFLSRRQLTQIKQQKLVRTQQIERVIHNRFATPIVNMLILVIGIPFFLNRQPASVIQSSGKCLLVCGVCFLLAFFSQNLVSDSYPALTAWLPLIVLTPLMVVTLDRLQT